jgi:hypothetical protein
MMKNLIAINLGLLLAVGLVGRQLYLSVGRFNEDNRLSKVQPPRDLKTKIATEGGLAALPAFQPLNPTDFSVVAANNLFSETRAKEEKVETTTEPVVPPLTVKPVLVGVTVAGNLRFATIVDPGATAAGGNVRKFQTKRLGDSYAGYTITDISHDRIVLEYGSRREVIPLYDAAKTPGQGGKTPILPTRVVAFGSGIQSSGTGISQQALLPPNAAPQRTQTPGAPVSATIGSSGGPTGGPPSAGITRTTPSTPGRQVPGQQATPTWNERIDDQGRRVVRTPFGDIIQDRPRNP